PNGGVLIHSQGRISSSEHLDRCGGYTEVNRDPWTTRRAPKQDGGSRRGRRRGTARSETLTGTVPSCRSKCHYPPATTTPTLHASRVPLALARGRPRGRDRSFRSVEEIGVLKLNRHLAAPAR